MDEFLQRLKRHKLVQWAAAYVAFAFALIQVLDVISDSYHWPDGVLHIVFGVLVLGFIVALVLAWYHGERGAQRISGPELLLIALVLAVGGGLLWHFGHSGSSADTAKAVATRSANPAATTARTATVASAPAANTIAAQPIPAKSIAVLPFENLSDDKKNEYFVAGMQDLILTKLADIGDLKVISRTSTMKYASHPDDLKTIGQQLGVATILEGSVQKAGDEVLINVQLIDAKTDSHIWAQVYRRKLDNIFGVEGDVAEKIAAALKAKLSTAETAQLAAVPTQNRAPYDAFLRAEYLANKGHLNFTTASWKAAMPLYRQAVALDPQFALAWARLSWNESNLAWFGGAGEDVKQLDQQARVDAERALQLQPKLAAAQIAIGYSDYWGRGDYDAALQAFAAALKLKPNDVDALAAQGYVYRRQGRLDEAIASFERALTLDPRNSALARDLGVAYMSTSRYADAKDAFQRALALDPDNLIARSGYAGAIVASTGDIPRALAAVQGDDPALKSTRVELLTYQRKYPEALALLDSIPDTLDNFGYAGSKAGQQADLYRLMGDDAHARALFAQALPGTRAQLAARQGINLAPAWQAVADVELGLGHTAPAMQAIGKAQAIVNQTVDHTSGPEVVVTGAALYAEARRADLAVPLLIKALAMPGIGAYYPPVLLWLDPSWDPIRHDQRFQALLKQYAKYKPAVTYDIAPAASPSASAH